MSLTTCCHSRSVRRDRSPPHRLLHYTSQKGLSVLCLLVFLHPNLFTISTLIGTVYNKYLALIGLSIFIHFQNPDVSSFGIYVRLGFCYLSTFTWLLVALQEHIPLCNCCKETKQHLHHNF